MKLKLLGTLIVSILTASALTALPVFAHDGDESADEHHHDGAKHEMAATSHHVSPEETLAQIHDLHTKLATTISEKKLSDVHHTAFAIRDLAATLPAMVSDDKKAKVDGTVKNIAAIASALDESGDSGDQAKTEANLKKLDGLLKVLEKQVS